ncbi:type II secretion system F family protein [Consotaella salsifontis]|uniref:Tight adherence protein B n=1 Tax=Consotaella salsifontis TaxID=1365950 RepID=A0A1T4PVS4_9HYPH|nr:type II secretion system F family protein [Consotaella salsifontis]SJZ95466.1 tight adherence protein B [Consotaella salsifontis]
MDLPIQGLAPQLPIFGLATLSVAAALTMVFYPKVKKTDLYESRFTAIAETSAPSHNRRDGGARRRRSVQETLRDLDERQKAEAKHSSSKPSLVRRMRQAQLSWSKEIYYLVSGGTGILSFIIALLFRIDTLPAIACGIAGALLLPHLFVERRRKRRFARFSAEFPTAVDVIVRGVKSGLPLGDCLKIIAVEAQEPVAGEFRTLVEDQTLGLPMDEAVGRLAQRVPLAETNFFAIVVAIQSRTGGSLAEALSNLSKVLRERKKMQGKIRAMSQEAKSSAAIIGALPVLVAVLVYLTSPDYIALLFTETIGNIVLAVCLLWMGIGILIMRKMINFDF